MNQIVWPGLGGGFLQKKEGVSWFEGVEKSTRGKII